MTDPVPPGMGPVNFSDLLSLFFFVVVDGLGFNELAI